MENQKCPVSEKQLTIYTICNMLLLGIATYASSVLTLSYFGSIGTDAVADSNLLMGLVNDGCTLFFTITLGYAFWKKNYAVLLLSLAVIAGSIYISYSASQSLDLNNSKKQVLKSSLKSELVITRDKKYKDLTQAKKEQKKIIDSMLQEKADKPTSHITAKKELGKQINDLIAINTDANNIIQKSIDSYDSKIENYKVSANETTEGAHAYARSIGTSVEKILAFKNKFMEFAKLVLGFNLGMLLSQSKYNLSSMLGSAYHSFKNRKKKDLTVETSEERIPDELLPEKTDNDNNNPPPSIPKDIHEAIKIYSKEAINSMEKDTSCDGLDKIARRTIYNRNKLLKAKSWLEHDGCLLVDGMGTFVSNYKRLKSYI